MFGGIIQEAIIWIVGGAIFIVGLVFLARDLANLQTPAYVMIGFGIILMLLVFLRSFARQRKEMLADFYGHNKQARLERAHSVAYHLYSRGQWEIKGDGEIRMRWDRDVRRFLNDHVGPDAVWYYCNMTERTIVGSQDRALSEEEMKSAMEVIKGWLDTDFQNYFHK